MLLAPVDSHHRVFQQVNWNNSALAAQTLIKSEANIMTSILTILFTKCILKQKNLRPINSKEIGNLKE
jgi:hypothetical protein